MTEKRDDRAEASQPTQSLLTVGISKLAALAKERGTELDVIIDAVCQALSPYVTPDQVDAFAAQYRARYSP